MAGAGRFLNNWPAWLRWTLLPPVSAMGAILIAFLFSLTATLLGVHGYSFDAFTKCSLEPPLLIALAAWIAPRNKFAVSVIFLVIALLVVAYGDFLVWRLVYQQGYPLSSAENTMNTPIDVLILFDVIGTILAAAVPFLVRRSVRRELTDKSPKS